MALTVEDNTGLANADSYVNLAAWRAYAAARGIDTADLTDDEAEQKLRQGFDYVNSYARFNSAPKSNDQAGEFPRVNLSDGMGRVFNTVPKRVKDAQCEAAIAAMEGPLFVVADRGGAVTSESVAGISVSYAPGSPAGRLYEAVQRLLAPFTRSDSEPRRPVPYFTEPSPADPVFRVGMDDNPQSASDY